MSYFVNKTDGTAIVVLDGTKDTTSTSLTLLGKLSSNYGENQNENFVRLLENFAYDTSPINPITGQLWYNTVEKTLKVYDLDDDSWVSVGTNLTGNIVTNGNLFLGTAQFEIQEYLGKASFINKTSNGNIVFFANVGGTITNVLNINGNNGLITVAGNATNNLGVTTFSYVRSAVDTAIHQLNSAFNSALNSNLATINSNISNVTANVQSINSSISSGNGPVNSKEILVNSNVVINNSGVGNTTVNFKTPGGVTILSASGASSLAAPVTILGQWSLGAGSTLNASYADLAEFYTSDNDYEPGTVVSFGGTQEVTVSKVPNDTAVAGVISQNPAYTMNNALAGTRACVALQGRVLCKVVGPVSKGDLLTTSDIAGCAVKTQLPILGSVIGKSLVNNTEEQPRLIEIVVGRM